MGHQAHYNWVQKEEAPPLGIYSCRGPGTCNGGIFPAEGETSGGEGDGRWGHGEVREIGPRGGARPCVRLRGCLHRAQFHSEGGVLQASEESAVHCLPGHSCRLPSTPRVSALVVGFRCWFGFVPLIRSRASGPEELILIGFIIFGFSIVFYADCAFWSFRLVVLEIVPKVFWRIEGQVISMFGDFKTGGCSWSIKTVVRQGRHNSTGTFILWVF